VNRATPVSVTLLTGHVDGQSVARAQEVGVLSYAVKPVTEGGRPSPWPGSSSRRSRAAAGGDRAPEAIDL